MGLKFERSDDLDKLFEEFAVDPDKKKDIQENKDIEKFLKPKDDKKKDEQS
ncbi:SPJ_0845 family protein [Enterococcus sp. AZ072]|uniref:SPJ_0845 family protein n=1 Tax=unclassified Enterococcus TaxID=2608891 RepID=UPI003D26F1F1